MRIGCYKITISWIGILIVLIPMIPNILWAILPQVEDGMVENTAPYPWIDQVMQICRVLMLMSLMLIFTIIFAICHISVTAYNYL